MGGELGLEAWRVEKMDWAVDVEEDEGVGEVRSVEPAARRRD